MAILLQRGVRGPAPLPHTRLAAVGELDAGGFESAPNDGTLNFNCKPSSS
jgi:hypothetical protein